MIQYLLVALVIIAAIIYALWRLRQSWRHRYDPCHDCTGCALKNQTCDKKEAQKFGQSK